MLLLLNLINKKKFDGRLKQADLASNTDIADFIKKANFDEELRKIDNKVISNKTKHLEAERKPIFCYAECI